MTLANSKALPRERPQSAAPMVFASPGVSRDPAAGPGSCPGGVERPPASTVRHGHATQGCVAPEELAERRCELRWVPRPGGLVGAVGLAFTGSKPGAGDEDCRGHFRGAHYG